MMKAAKGGKLMIVGMGDPQHIAITSKQSASAISFLLPVSTYVHVANSILTGLASPYVFALFCSYTG